MRTKNSRKFIVALTLAACVSPIAVAAQTSKAVYEDYSGVPKSLRNALESGDVYDNGYARKTRNPAISDYSRNLNAAKQVVYEESIPVITAETKVVVDENPAVVKTTTMHQQETFTRPGATVDKPEVLNSVFRDPYSGYTYSEAEAKDAGKLGMHALAQDAIVGASPTLPVRSIEIKRDKFYKEQEGKRYILDDDGSKFELKGQKVNIYDGSLLPEGYEVEKKPIKIPSYQLKGLYKEDSTNTKKNSKEYLKLNFLKKHLDKTPESYAFSHFQPFQLANEGDVFTFPDEASVTTPSEKLSRRPVTNNARRPANTDSNLTIDASNIKNTASSRSFEFVDEEAKPKTLKEKKSPSSLSKRQQKRPINPQSKVYDQQSTYMNPLSQNLEATSMEEVLAVAYKENPNLNSSREALKASDETIPQAFSGYLPRISANISNAYTKSENEDGDSGKFYPDTQSLDIQQSIFGGGETYYALKAAKNRVLAARNELRSVEQDFLLEGINAYIDLIFTKKVLILSENNENVLSQQLESAKERFIIGDATRTDVAQSEARLANAVSNRVIANGDYINAKSNYRRVFQMDPPENMLMPTALPEIPLNFDDAMSAAISVSPNINRAKYLLEASESEIDQRTSQLYPQLDLDADITRRDSVSGNSLFETNSESVSLNLTIPLYTQGTNFSRVREAENRKSQSRFEYQNALNQLRDRMQQSWQNLTVTASNIEATKASLVASEYALEGVKEEQKEGARTILDVLDAEQERFQSEISHARAIKDSVLAVYQLKSAMGELNPESLSLPVRSYNPEIHYNETKNKLFGF